MTTTCPACGNARFIFAGTTGASVPCPCVRVKELEALGMKLANALDSYAEMRWADVLDDWDNALAGDGATA